MHPHSRLQSWSWLCIFSPRVPNNGLQIFACRASCSSQSRLSALPFHHSRLQLLRAGSLQIFKPFWYNNSSSLGHKKSTLVERQAPEAIANAVTATWVMMEAMAMAVTATWVMVEAMATAVTVTSELRPPQSGFQSQEEETCLDKNLEVQSSHLLNLVVEEIQGELPSVTMKNQEKVNILPLKIEGQLGEVEIMPTETKQEDVPKEEEEKAQVSFEVFNGESPLTKSDFNDYFVIDMVDEILQKNTYEDPFEIYLIQAKDPIKEYINCLNTSSSSLESNGAILEELGKHISWPKSKPPQNSHWRKSYGGFNLRARKPRFKKTRGHALRPDPKPPWSGRKSSY
ncbi:hypothetical protein SLEP1_g33934 [Rubroshorea leprosula]|uniref:Uncharacterized protein n=1 Tax=Rubroshorea leprosula TaxID=152421 RepID=A0AAV5KI81_9ROSI|nr:hypothetical protein SLEP1_g33934 [Rubroshorea leprosula]